MTISDGAIYIKNPPYKRGNEGLTFCLLIEFDNYFLIVYINIKPFLIRLNW